jgi:hypothetical protein
MQRCAYLVELVGKPHLVNHVLLLVVLRRVDDALPDRILHLQSSDQCAVSIILDAGPLR